MNQAKDRLFNLVITFLAAVVMFISMPSRGAALIQDEVSDSLLFIEEGLKLRKEMRFAPDYRMYMERLNVDPMDTGALNGLGRILIEYDNLDSAEAVFKSEAKAGRVTP